MHFRGVTNLSLDAKGRMVFPSRYRERLSDCCGGRLVVTVDFNHDPCLRIYPLPEWEEAERKVMSLPSVKKKFRQLQRVFVGNATECDMDGSGRILVPTLLRQLAKLDKRIVLVGQGERFELWDEDAWNSQQSQWLDEDEGDLEALEELSQLSL